MLNISLKSTYVDSTGFSWEYYQDDADAGTYYILPRPQFVTNGGKPSFQIVTFTTDDPATNGAGYCRFDIELAVPADVQAAIQQQIQQRAPGTTPIFKALDELPGGQASILLSSATKTITAVAPVSGFGSDVASFVLHLTKDQVATLQAAFTTSGGAAEAEYRLKVPARLPAVNAVMSFDSTIAYSYQVTQPSYNEWGDETSPGSVQKLLNESQSSKVQLSWGVTNPPAELQTAVASWANATLADEVQAQVQATINLQGLSSDSSFNINEVSSFTSEYDSSEVINWILVPTQTLPSFPEMGQPISAFVSSVNEQQQVMQVTTQLLFTADGSGGGGVEPVEKLTVTVNYPGLSEADGTYVFTDNGSHTFATAFDPQHGPAWDLQYVATYAGNTAPVQGTISSIQQGSYTLTLPDVGVLSVDFDASNAFNDAPDPAPQEIHVSLTYPNFDGHGNPYIEQLKLSPDTQSGVIASISALPVNAAYNWQVQYVFPGLTVTGPLNQGAIGANQTIPAPAGVHETKVFIVLPAESDTVVLEADVGVYYQGQPQQIPGAPATYPSKQSPANFSLTPSAKQVGKQQVTFATDTFYGLINGNQPLVYSATITTESGQVVIDDQLVESDQPSILVNPDQRYFTVEVNPGAIDWNSASFSSVKVLLTPAGISPAQGERELTWNKGETDPQYVTWPMKDTDTLTYSWYASYCIVGDGWHQTAKVTGASDILLPVPAQPPANGTVLSFELQPVLVAGHPGAG